MSIKFKIRINDGEIQNFAFKPNPTFGSVIVPVTLWFDVSRSKLIPEKVKIGSKTDFSFSSFTSALHYGQSIFEGMKAFKLESNKIGVYRLDDYAKRFKNSAKIMGMPEFDEVVFKTCIKKYLECIRNLVPKEEGHSLYLRPIMFAQDPIIKVSVSESYRFMIMASIVGPYFTSGKTGVKVYCNQGYTRAFPNGSGAAKTAANYALSLPHLQVANKLGYEQVLYLD